MLPLDHPDRIQFAFDDHRLVNNAGLILPRHAGPAPGPAPTRPAGPRPGQCAGQGEHRRQDHDAGGVRPRFRGGRVWLAATASTTPTCCALAGRLAPAAARSRRHPPPPLSRGQGLAGGDCIDDADVLRAGGTAGTIGCTVKAPSTPPAFARAGSGDLPAQLPVGPRPPTGPGEPGVAGTGLGRWGGTGRRAPDHRPGLHHLRNLWAGQGRRPPPQLHRPSGAITRCWPLPPEPATC